jgi:site-specific DNA-methyltransferase (adenine-specific)
MDSVVNETIQLMLGDCSERLKTVPENSIDAIVTDPPYALVQNSRNGSAQPGDMSTPYGRSGPSKERGFMGHDWDYGDVAFDPIFWKECLRVLKPGGHLLAFGGSRTYHRLASAIDDAGFEIRDQIMWLYGQGFPKSLDVSKAIVKKGRPKVIKDDLDTSEAAQWKGWGTALKPAHEPIVVARKPLIGTVAENVLKHGTGGLNIDACRVPNEEAQVASGGRWPANVIHDGSEEVREGFPNAPGQLLPTIRDGAEQGNNIYGKLKRVGPSHEPRNEQDKSAARFFYCAKASKKDRGDDNIHPTVKPTELMRYLVRLVTPPGGTVLDPFMGSGSTGKACALEGLRFIGIERERPYIDVARRRIEKEYALAV